MIIFLYGQDTYRMQEKLREIVANYKKINKNSLSLRYFDGDNMKLEDFKNNLQTNSIFKEKRLIILKNGLANFKDENKLLNLLKKNKDSDDILIIFEGRKIDERNLLTRFLKKSAKFQEFKPLEGEKLKNWLKKEFSKYQAEIGPRALDKLITYTGNDLWQIDNEVKKLVNFKTGKEIKLEDIELLVRPKINTDIFKTIDAIAQRDRKKALSLIYKHLEKGDSSLYLISMIAYQFRNLLIIKNLIEKKYPYYGILKASKMHPFVVKKSYELAYKFGFSELKKIYQRIFQVDLSIKTGKITPETGLDLLLAELY